MFAGEALRQTQGRLSAHNFCRRGRTRYTESAHMSSNVKLLLVDDSPMVLGLLKQSLSTLAQVVTAGDAADALLKAVDDPPDLLVTDYRMPGMDGRQLIEKLRSRPATA